MRPIVALFQKEFRQHGSFAAGMIFLCQLFQATYFLSSYRFPRGYVDSELLSFFSLAILTTLLYAGAAAALAYSTEVADKTISFLRRLPISPTMLALGKSGWVLCGTLIVLIVNLQLAAIWVAIAGGMAIWNLPDTYKIGLAYGIGIIEVLIWGFFWSTRCRNHFHALLATYLSAATSLYVITYFFATSIDVVDMYIDVIPHRLAVSLLLTIPAVRGMARWFTYEGKRPLTFRYLPDSFILIRYPQKVQPPFLALIHQHVRHASLLYHFGILCFLLWPLGWISVAFFPETFRNSPYWTGIGFFGGSLCLIGLVLFWGTIFGHDQRNDSYRFLTRLGVSYHKIWWSRMLLPLLFYFLALLCTFVGPALAQWNAAETYTLTDWKDAVFGGSLVLTVWLTPAAMGAFFSISLRNQMLTVALTGAGSIGFYIFMMMFHIFTGHSPHWTTLPMCIAILIASRMRTKYWIRETFTWRSRLIPLVPLFGVMLAIAVAHPSVRIHSVPYVSWKEIESFFDQSDIPVRMPPEKRSELIRRINLTATPAQFPEYHDFFSCIESDPSVIENYAYDEYLLLHYVYAHGVSWRDDWTFRPLMALLRASPWEQERRHRLGRIHIVRLLIESDRLKTERTESLKKWWEKDCLFSTLDDDWQWDFAWYNSPESKLHNVRMDTLWTAMEKWYVRHQTLPESLDDLVPVYLDALPMYPFTQDVMVEYHVDAPPPEDIRPGIRVMKRDDSVPWQRREEQERLARAAFLESGGTYLRSGGKTWIIIGEFAPEEPEK